MQPVQPDERVNTLDILRGFAIFGILLVNMAFFSSPFLDILTGADRWTGFADQSAKVAIRFVAEGKFYSLFSLLFGLGYFIQMSRADQRGAKFSRIVVRRLLMLLLIGQLHAHLLWSGDILTMYAVVGFFLLLFRRRRPKTLIIWAVVLLCLPPLAGGCVTGMFQLAKLAPQGREAIAKALAEQTKSYERMADEAREDYSSGTYTEIGRTRRSELFIVYTIAPFSSLPSTLGMFLLGLYVGCKGVYRAPPETIPLIRRTLWWGLGLGILGNAGFAVAIHDISMMIPSVRTFLGGVSIAVGAPAMCLFYVCALTLLLQRDAWRGRLLPLAAVGRMALTNYLLQSVVCTTLFYSYGFALFDKVGPALGLLLTFAIFVSQVPLSNWWLKHFHYGPAEWLWRSCTYLRVQPLRR
jgi:uncharacterized protein